MIAVSGAPSTHQVPEGDLNQHQLLENAAGKGQVSNSVLQGSANQAVMQPSAASSQDDLTIGECRAQAAAFANGPGYGKSRFASCQAHTVHMVSVDCWFLGFHCEITAAANVDVTDLQFTNYNDRSISVLQAFQWWGLYGNLRELTMTANVTCTPASGACTPDPGAVGPYRMTVAQWVASAEANDGTGIEFYLYQQPEASGQGPDKISSATLNWHFRVDGADGAIHPDGPNSGTRCDSAPYLPAPGGCVFPWVTETLTYNGMPNAKPKVAPVAQHIFNAERSLPSHWGVPRYRHPLTRTVSTTIEDANRRVACGKMVNKKGFTCDEYPLAKTYQGASRVAANDYSAVSVPAAANLSQGGITKQFFTQRRILDGDPFWVLAILSNGTRSW